MVEVVVLLLSCSSGFSIRGFPTSDVLLLVFDSSCKFDDAWRIGTLPNATWSKLPSCTLSVLGFDVTWVDLEAASASVSAFNPAYYNM